MQQQINLFQPIFRKERKILSFVALVEMCAIMVMALGGIYGYGLWSNSGLNREIGNLKKLHDERIRMLERVSRRAAEHQETADTQSQIKRLEAELAAENYVVSLLGKDKFAGALGFSGYLEIFSRRVVQGMWLSRFSVSDGGEHMLIKGGALSADLLPQFLQGLSDEPSLAGMEFTVLHMVREPSGSGWIEFVLSSKELETSPVPDR